MVLSFLWQFADALLGASCCRQGHTQLLPSVVMEKGKRYMGQGGSQVSGGQSARAPEHLGRNWLGDCGGVPVSYPPWNSGGVACWVSPCPTLVDG